VARKHYRRLGPSDLIQIPITPPLAPQHAGLSFMPPPCSIARTVAHPKYRRLRPLVAPPPQPTTNSRFSPPRRPPPCLRIGRRCDGGADPGSSTQSAVGRGRFPSGLLRLRQQVVADPRAASNELLKRHPVRCLAVLSRPAGEPEWWTRTGQRRPQSSGWQHRAGPVARQALIAAALAVDDVLRQSRRVGGHRHEQRCDNQLHVRYVASERPVDSRVRQRDSAHQLQTNSAPTRKRREDTSPGRDQVQIKVEQ
jgi:hypothetical protein